MVRRPESLHVRRSRGDTGFENRQRLSVLKLDALFVMFSSGLSSVCHFGHDGVAMSALVGPTVTEVIGPTLVALTIE